MASRTLKMEVMRYNPEQDTAPYFQTFDVPYDNATSCWMR